MTNGFLKQGTYVPRSPFLDVSEVSEYCVFPDEKMEDTRLELVAFCMPCKRSPN
jgi:hypothetical protein